MIVRGLSAREKWPISLWPTPHGDKVSGLRLRTSFSENCEIFLFCGEGEETSMAQRRCLANLLAYLTKLASASRPSGPTLLFYPQKIRIWEQKMANPEANIRETLILINSKR
jgi:hypothetical protein